MASRLVRTKKDFKHFGKITCEEKLLNSFQLLVATLIVAVVNGYPRPYPQGAIAIPRPGPDGSYGKDHYFQVIF